MNCPVCDSEKTKRNPEEEGGEPDERLPAFYECLVCEYRWQDDYDPGAAIDYAYERVKDREISE